MYCGMWKIVSCAVRTEHTKKTDPEIANLVRELAFKMPVWCMSIPFRNDFFKKCGVFWGFVWFWGWSGGF